LYRQDHEIGLSDQLIVGSDRSPTHFRGERGRPARTGIGEQHFRWHIAVGPGPTPSHRGGHVSRTYKSDDHVGKITGQDWLKNPLSIRRAFSSAETSTLRGVSRKTFSAIRCIPPSRA